jgi:hypothetical protein
MKTSCSVVRWAILFANCLLAINFCSATYPLNQTCSPPQAQGGTGYCGPSLCANAGTSLPACVFTTTKTFNYATLVSQTATKKCTQSTDPRCKSAALKALMSGPGVKAAFCNDLFLVLQTDGSSGFPTYLQSIMFPPAAVANGVTCVTRYTNPTFMISKIPLYPILLSTSDPAINNVNTKSFPSGASDSSTGYMSSSVKYGGSTYGLPTRGKI